MPRYVAFLRAVNIAPRWVKMAALREALTEAGFGQVETYIQSGNVAFTSPLRSRQKVTVELESALAAHCGFAVTAIVMTPAELRRVYDDAEAFEPPLPGEPRRYVVLLQQQPTASQAAEIDSWAVEGERARVKGRAVHVWLTKPMNKVKMSNARAEKALGAGTMRDLKVIRTLAERWGA